MDDSLMFFNNLIDANKMLNRIRIFIKKYKLTISKWSISYINHFSFIGKVFKYNKIYISKRMKKKIINTLKYNNRRNYSSYYGIVKYTNNNYLYKQLNEIMKKE